MTRLERMAKQYAQGTDDNSWDARDGFEAGFLAAREEIVKFLGPPWPYANLNARSGEVTWDRDGIKLIQSDIAHLGDEAVP